MTETLAELLAAKTKDELLEQLLAALTALGFPTTDWNPGAVVRTMAELIAYGEVDLEALIAKITAGGYTTLAAELEDGRWLDLLAEQIYDLERDGASAAVQLCTVANTSGGTYTVRQGAIAEATSGRRYIYQGTDAAITNESDDDLEFTAEETGSVYNADGADSITTLVDAIDGVTITNALPLVGGLDVDGTSAKPGATNAGTGVVTPTATTGVASRRYSIRVVTSGDVGAGSVVVTYYDSTLTKREVTLAPIPASYTSASPFDTHMTIAFTDGAGSPAFVAGDTYGFSTPGSPLVNAGTDDESNASLAARCRGRWPSLADVPLEDRYLAWVHACSLENLYGITKASIHPSGTVAGRTDIVLATDGGAPGAAAILAIQNYIDARDGICDLAYVTAATPESIAATGTVTVKRSLLTTIQTAAQTAWDAYLAALPIGGDASTGSPGVVRLLELTQALMDAGAIDCSGLELEGAAVNYVLSPASVAVKSGELADTLTWVTVA